MVTVFHRRPLSRIAFHAMFWLISFYILLSNFSTSSKILNIDIIYTLVYLFGPFIAVYVNLYFMLPRFFQRRRYFIYALAIAGLILISIWIHYLSFEFLIDILFKNYYLISYMDTWQVARTTIIFLGVTSLAQMSLSWFELRESREKLREAEKEKAVFQLESLRAQINPHFLFNSLNSIYSLALQKSDQAPAVILKLSDVLRYVIYDSATGYVELKKEIEFIANYIALQKLRTNVSDLVTLKILGEPGDRRIAPMIFIVFIENAFKHGLKGDIKNQFIQINFTMDEQGIEFSCTNNAGMPDRLNHGNPSGFGLDNVRKRLELIYKGSYILDISPDKEVYRVRLKIIL
ncbi:MAG TPA: sensor histidine kinase [Cyclobacteriaceae bacterium]|nr:sensor histidine kinase [Cyclobacteriaceae bacterium]